MESQISKLVILDSPVNMQQVNLANMQTQAAESGAA